ncbi:MAG: regulator of sigma E protease [Planctomycetota bacterium]|jgi:regulator of sigma E protease
MAFGSILLAILGIGLLIFLHEGGHFIAARLAGVRVEVFSLGFGPRLGGFFWRGTDFRLSAVPFGGYVMVAGQDPSDRRYSRSESLYSKSVGQRALFWSGGVIMNVLFALIVFPIVFGAGVNFEAPIAGTVPRGSAAWEAGIVPGERIVEVAGKQVYSFQNQMIEVALHGNRPVQLLVEGIDGEQRALTVEPQFDKDSGLYGLGLRPAFDATTAILTIDETGPAKTAGLATGDLVLSINGQSPAEPGAIDGLGEIAITVQRDGQELDFTLLPNASVKDVLPLIGVVPLAKRVTGIRPGCALLDRLGLLRGDDVLAIDDQPLLDSELDRILTGPAQMRWLVLRDGQEVKLAQTATADDRAQLVEHLALAPELSLQVQPIEGGAAILAGVLPGDWFEAINGIALASWDDLRSTVEAAGNKPLKMRLRRPKPGVLLAGLNKPTGEIVELTILPKVTAFPEMGWKLEVAPKMIEIQAESFGEAVKLGTVCSLDLIKQMYVTLKRLVTGEVGAKNLGGIIRISQVSYQAAQRGPSWFWYFLALLSVNLAFVNVLPIPVLDGGHLMFLLIEKVKGSPVSTKVFGYSQVIGLVFVLLLVLFVTYNDILRLL